VTLKDEWSAVGAGHLSASDSMKGTLREGSFTGEPKDMLSKARKLASSSIWAPLLGNMEVCFFNTAFLFRGILMRFSREMQMPCKRISRSKGALLGNLEWVRLPGFLREKKKVYLGSFLGPRGQ